MMLLCIRFLGPDVEPLFAANMTKVDEFVDTASKQELYTLKVSNESLRFTRVAAASFERLERKFCQIFLILAHKA